MQDVALRDRALAGIGIDRERGVRHEYMRHIVREDVRFRPAAVQGQAVPPLPKAAPLAGASAEELAAAGGNSIRADVTALDRAQALGLSVLIDLPFGKQRWGFDYDDPAAVQRVVFCSGKVAWDAFAERAKRAAPVAIARVEQLYPFPGDQMRFSQSQMIAVSCMDEESKLNVKGVAPDRLSRLGLDPNLAAQRQCDDP